MMGAVVLHIRENENEASECLGSVPYDGVAHLGAFRAFLEGFKEEEAIVPWHFDFWDSQRTMRIHKRLEKINSLKFHHYEVTAIRSHGESSMVGSELKPGEVSMAVTEPTTLEESSSKEEASCLQLESKHKIFLSHSGAQKPFIEQLCKDLEAHNHFAFFDQRSTSLPKGEKFSTLIIDAARRCRVAVVVLRRVPYFEMAEAGAG